MDTCYAIIVTFTYPSSSFQEGSGDGGMIAAYAISAVGILYYTYIYHRGRTPITFDPFPLLQAHCEHDSKPLLLYL